MDSMDPMGIESSPWRPSNPAGYLLVCFAMERPKLRYLEPIPHRENGQEVVILRDPLRVSPQMLAVTPALYAIMARFDGSRTPHDVLAEVQPGLGDSLGSQDLEGILRQFDDALFLDNERFRRQHSRLLEEFRTARVREPSHAGASYPMEATELAEALGRFYAEPSGAGLPGPGSGPPPQAIIAPHIDPRLGGPCYTHAYKALAERTPPDLFVILGTGHHGLPELFSVSRKDFETPLGTARTDRDFADRLQENAGPGLFLEDLAHRSEHTIEFQAVFLQHLFRNRPFTILPVLVSFSYLNFEVPAVADAHRALFDRFVSALEKTACESGRRVCYLASVDLAHIGPRYGDEFRPGEEHIDEARSKDREMLDLVLGGDGEGFYRFVKEEEDRRRICGFSPLYTLLALLPGRKGELLDHSHSVMGPSGSFVTYASAVVE